MKHIFLLSCVAVLAACSSSPNTLSVTAAPITVEPREMFDAKNIVASKTANPDAARFEGFQAYALSNGDRLFCGDMNSVPFYIRQRGRTVKSVHYTAESADFSTGKCAEAARGAIRISPH